MTTTELVKKEKKTYRITRREYKNGRLEFHADVRWCGIWLGLDYEGSASLIYAAEYAVRERVLKIIDLHFAGNARTKSVSREIIIKS